ncbi:MAG: alpha/beta hydrolase [Proteobacteria bacterium]|nr:alpha/beta hydrolase [Pseudomonadota bacterium]MDE3208005.1 alpha/beta hydrolase [Pseudomonadota bacterium]
MSSNKPTQLLFLPGALGDGAFWSPVARLIQYPATQVQLSWFDSDVVPVNRKIGGLEKLVAWVVSQINQPTAIVAQSMGGVVAIRACLENPGLVTHLVLCATSGGLDLPALGLKDWRPDFYSANPDIPCWFAGDEKDLAFILPRVTVPVMLVWGEVDIISPVSVGQYLHTLFSDSCLHIIAGGDHDVGYTHPFLVSSLIDRHLIR